MRPTLTPHAPPAQPPLLRRGACERAGMWRENAWARRVAIGLPALILVLLALAQLVLPSIAADRISSRVGRYGHVDSVSVSAWPAVELLWGHADSVKVHARALRMSPAQSVDLLAQGRGVSRIDARVDELREGSLRLTDATLRKRGSALHAQGTVSAADAAAALPAGVGVSLIGSRGGAVEVRVTGGLFGVGAAVDAVAQAGEGRLIVHPTGVLLGALRLTLFADPRIAVEGVEAGALGGAEAGYRLGMSASLR